MSSLTKAACPMILIKTDKGLSYTEANLGKYLYHLFCNSILFVFVLTLNAAHIR